MHIARWLLKAAPDDFKPYESLTNTLVFLASLSDSVPKKVSVTSDFTYAFKISPYITSISLRVAIIKVI